MSISILLPRRRRAWHDRLAAALRTLDDNVSIDLSEGGAAAAGAGPVLRPLYDGSPDSGFLLGRLQRRECPYLEVVDETGATISASYAAIEDKGDVARGADQAFARIEALLLRALAGQASPIPPRPERPAARYSRARAVKAAARRLAGRLLAPIRGRGAAAHWNIALRREAGAPDLARFDLAAWRPLPADPDIFYADPFIFEEAGRSWLFAEACPYATGKGVIACAPLTDAGEAGPWRTVLEQPWHLSYPYVLRDGGEIWLVPESAAEGGIELHRATAFPDQWLLERRLFEDLRLVDATFFDHDGRLWLFAGRIGDNGGSSWDELFAWHAPGLQGPWEPHRLNPIKSDCRGARPGGRPLKLDGRLFRPAQLCERFYGEALIWFEIVTLTPDAFAEVEVATWRAAGPGMSGPHSADLAGGIRAVDFRRARG